MLAPLPEKNDLDEIDRDALTRALEMTKKKAATDPFLKGVIDDLARGEDWFKCAEAAAYLCQRDALNLPPWADPPMWAELDNPSYKDKDATSLLRRMSAAGLSRWEPDLPSALEKAERKRKSTKRKR
jgi:hypothetical protein